MNVIAFPTPVPAVATIRPWVDPVVDQKGHSPKGPYVEAWWLSVIGPTALLVMRRFADRFDQQPEGFEIDLERVAASMGLSYARGDASPFGRALHRCVMFGLAKPSSDGFVVRRRFPNVAHRHLKRLPEDLQAEHAEWVSRTIHVDARNIEQALLSIGVAPAAAACACEAVLRAS